MRLLAPLLVLAIAGCLMEPTGPTEPDLEVLCYPDDWLHPCEPPDTVVIEIVIPNPNQGDDEPEEPSP